MTTTTETPYIYIDSNHTAWFFAPAADDADDTEINLSKLPAEDADAFLAHGYRVIIEGVNDDDTLGV